MGYDLHITRKEEWSEDGLNITIDEWLSMVENDPELSIDERNGPCFAMWKPLHSCGEYWLDWFEGNIYTKNPDQVVICKMIEIAHLFDARVQGDDGEIYDEKQMPLIRSETKKKSSWLERIFGK